MIAVVFFPFLQMNCDDFVAKWETDNPDHPWTDIEVLYIMCNHHLCDPIFRRACPGEGM